MPVRIVTDSAADLTAQRLRQEQIQMVPLTVHFGAETWFDQVDLDGDAFWARLAESRDLPRTAAPSPGAFAGVYADLLSQGMEVVSIHLSGALSGTVRSAEAGRQLVDGPVSVVDGRSASLGTGLLVLWAARAAAAGWPRGAVAAEVERLAGRLRVYFSLDTLEYLARGGRIGQAARLIGGVLDVKPILTLTHGTVHPLRRVRGARQVVAGLTGWMTEAAFPDPVVAAVATSPQVLPAMVAELRQRVEERVRVLGWESGSIGPVIGVHAGPGALGLVVLPLDDEARRVWEEGGPLA